LLGSIGTAVKGPWTGFERLMLIRSVEEMLLEIAEAMKRPLGDVVSNASSYGRFFEEEYGDQA